MIGPEIPSHLLRKGQGNKEDDEHFNVESAAEDNTAIGPVIPAELLNKRQNEQTEAEDDADADADADAYAPALPPDLLEARQKVTSEGPRRRRQPVGPSLPVTAYAEDDDEVIGPALPSNYNPEELAVKSAIVDIEERARRSKEHLEKPDEPQKIERPEWMLLPPEVDYLKQATTGKSRTFSNRQLDPKERDRSVWTDSPAEKLRKLQEGSTGNQQGDETGGYNARDTEIYGKMSERAESLMQMHKKKRKSTRVEVEDVRNRPFDREKDVLGGYKPMDKKQKKDFLRQSNELGSRFGRGSSSFL
ncbi:hypothetical protein DFQ30_005669 [Apophysomyces sp. BC1015]|nr:hypothetical protein DFQ30_005669 [Apophysomyces sp. BC1015]KAG0177634.1 hypothetical protein DFQ29_004623 [Apophysomyces sp. BC1021]